jgi:UDP-N-acetyl-D-glucosamine/UDP-N-acetyl-D-galactosamine dehydrogenase
MNNNLSGVRICIIGLGYVGLPLAVEFGKKFPTVGFDINDARIQNLSLGIDKTMEVSPAELTDSLHLTLTSDVEKLKLSNVFIVTVPTPVDLNRKPDLGPLLAASKLVGSVISPASIVIYESTVYPGATEDECIPVIEKISNLKYNIDFFAGYSPERINPGDKEHNVTSITKITSGSNPATADFVDLLYRSIVNAGTYKARSIKVAEAAKVIENTQRDLNIALVNELAIIFNKLNIDTEEVLLAAGTKWNFLPFKPGLVGGHCIGVDPYYLTYKAEALGYNPQVILAGRRINDNMGSYVASIMIKKMLKKRIHVNGSKVLVMGLTFKENCPDVRNTKVVDIINELIDYGVEVDIYDPWVQVSQAQKEHGINTIDKPNFNTYDGIFLAVAHGEFISMGAKTIKAYGKANHVFYDLKSIFSIAESDVRL